MSAAVRPPESEEEFDRGARLRRGLLGFLRYLLVLITFAGFVASLLILRTAYLSLAGFITGGSTDFTVVSRVGLLDKALLIVLAIAALAVTFVADAYYGKARTLLELMRRFARMAAWVVAVLFAAHASLWMAAGHHADLSLIIPVGEAVIASALFALSARRPRPRA